ncbi:hypothetical protein [Variovorax sp. dw_308]|uniref:hypothetical protein n=1 Tax=Variovorax sp. dw_308 TaxID=2721546 RepID=UPI001C4386C1|nr:hypothetical protein [Variovorax sp. dw_308]
MNGIAVFRRALGKHLVVLGLAAAGVTATGVAAACTLPGHGAPPSGWMQEERNPRPQHDGPGIVGMWKSNTLSPTGDVLDFGTQQFHSDGTEFLISGGRAPSTGDVCMGVWEQIGPATYKIKHIALGYLSSDSSPPVVPAAFAGPAIIHQIVTLSPSGNKYTGTYTVDIYAKDGVTLVGHGEGTLTGVRFTVD